MKIFKRTLLALLVLIVLAVLYFIIFVYHKPHVDYLVAEVEKEVVAKDLYHDFVNNQLEANKKYNGKVLLVTGVVNEIEITEELEIAIMIFGDGFFGDEGIRFTMLEGQIEKVVKDVPIALKGFCTGFTGTDVIIEHASVVK